MQRVALKYFVAVADDGGFNAAADGALIGRFRASLVPRTRV
jgi:hypothetical protein